MNGKHSIINMLRRSLPVALLTTAGQAAAAPPPHDISGTWAYLETARLVLKPAEDTLHMTCMSDGVLVISQSGANFSGTLTHFSSTCMTKDGEPVPPPWLLPYEAYFTGRVTGQGFQIDQFDAPPAPPVHCPKQGSLRVEQGEVIEIRTTGRCDLSDMPFPITAKNFGVAQRP